MCAALVVLLTAACGAAGPDATDSTGTGTADTQIVNADDVVEAALDIRAGGCGPRIGFGTGTLIDDRLTVTAAHVVAGADTVVTIDVAGVERSAEVVLFDPDLDVAVLRSDRRHDATPIPIRDTPARADDAGLMALPRSNGDTVDVELIEVRVLRRAEIVTTDIYLDTDVTRAGYEIDGRIDRGDSGASIVTDGGAVGIVWARSRSADDRAWAIDFPPEVTDADRRRALATTPPVDVGPCIRS